MQEFFAFVRVGFATAATGFDAEKVRLHHCVSPGQQLHAHIGSRLEDFSLIGAHQTRSIAGSFEERKNVRSIEARNAAQRGNRGAHLAALEGAKETDGNSGSASHLGKREAAASPQAAEALPGQEPALRWSSDNSLAFEHVNDGGRIEASRAAQENGALQQANIGFGEKAITAPRALRRDEAQGFPGAQRRGRNAYAACHLADAQQARRFPRGRYVG